MENSGLTAFEFALLCCLLFCFLVIIDIPSLSKYFLTTGISAATNSYFFVCFLFLSFACNLWIFIYRGQISCHKVFSILPLHIGTIQWFTMRPQSLNSLPCSIYCFISPRILIYPFKGLSRHNSDCCSGEILIQTLSFGFLYQRIIFQTCLSPNNLHLQLQDICVGNKRQLRIACQTCFICRCAMYTECPSAFCQQ